MNFESIKEAVLREGEDGESQEIILKSRNIRRTREFDVVTTPEIKQYRVTSEKRRFLEDYSSRPYGYKRSREET